MINELSRLSDALNDANIETESWHQNYKKIPNIKPDAPCVRILLYKGNVYKLSSIEKEHGKTLRKFGNNQGSFPAMNLKPLYRISDETTASYITELIKNNSVGTDAERIKSLCVKNNWNSIFLNKYKISICNRAEEIKKQTNSKFEPLNFLLESVKPYEDAEILHVQLSERIFEMLSRGENIKLALQILFEIEKAGKQSKDEKKNNQNLSVIFDCKELEDNGVPVISPAFTKGVNNALQTFSDSASQKAEIKEDAFGIKCILPKEPMPTVKLPAGFEVALRTMFSGQPCQSRYSLFEGDAYPISTDKRKEIKKSLEWLGNEDNKNKTWVKTGKNEAFFAYPSKLPENKGFGFVQVFSESDEEDEDSESESKEKSFIAVSENFTEFITKTKQLDPSKYPEFIQLFALNKYDKARTRVMYSRITTPDEIIRNSEKWQKAADNLPPLSGLKKPKILFPLQVPDVMNRIWNRNGEMASDKFRHIGRYHGIDLLFGVNDQTIKEDLHELTSNSENMAVYAQTAFSNSTKQDKAIIKYKHCLKQVLSLMGMFLYWSGIRKDDYMNEYPFLLGQLLKISDLLHELYCQKVRNNQLPTQLVGSSMYSAASELPLQTFSQLTVRIQPYVAWAKTHRFENTPWKDKDEKEHHGISANYLLRMYELTADKLKTAFSAQTRFNDAEKAQLFIGYMASFEKNNIEKIEDEGENINE